MTRKARLLTLLPLLAIPFVVIAFLWSVNVGPASDSGPDMLDVKQHTSVKVQVGTSNLLYHNGPIMAGKTQAYAIFWEPAGSYVSPNYNKLILRYFSDVGSSSLYHTITQYRDKSGNIPSGAVLGGSWVDTAKYPSSSLSDAQIQAEVSHAMKVKHWTASLTHSFFVFTAKGENICVSSACSFSRFCAYHYYFGKSTIYAAIPYTGTNLNACGVSIIPNNDVDADSTINVTSHEQIEAATSPLTTAWYDSQSEEIGDKCARNFDSTVTWNGNLYFVQKEWDNAKSGCVLSGPWNDYHLCEEYEDS